MTNYVTDALSLDPTGSLQDRVAWAILQALHKDVAEDERPQSWSDMNSDQEKRIRVAAYAAMAAMADCLKAVENLGIAAGRRQGMEEALREAGLAAGKNFDRDPTLDEVEARIRRLLIPPPGEVKP